MRLWPWSVSSAVQVLADRTHQEECDDIGEDDGDEGNEADDDMDS